MINKALFGLLITALLSFNQGAAEANEYNFDFFALFENHGSIMLLIEAESGAIIRANKAAAAFYGYPKDVLESMTIQQINMLSPEEVAQERRAAAAQKRNHFIFPHRLADGTIRTVEVYSYPFLLGEVTILFSIVQDITDREASRLQLQQSLQRLTRAEQITGLGHWELHLDTGMVTGSDGAEVVYGLTGNIWPIAAIQAIPLPEYRSMLDTALDGLIHRNEPYNVRFRIRGPADGRILYIHSMAEYNPEKKIVFGTIHNITGEMEKAALLRRNQNLTTYSLIAFILILMMFIWLLGLNVRRRKIAESSLKNWLRMERLITQVSTSFVSSSAENLHAKITEMMALVGEELNVDRCSLLEFTPSRENMTINHQWCRDGIDPEKQHYVSMPLQNYPWLAKQILTGKYIFVPDVANLPEEAAVERADLQRQRIRTLLMIPTKLFKQITGYLVFAHAREIRRWSYEEIAFLIVLSNILSDAMEKSMIENKLYSEKERLKITLSSVGDGVITTDNQGRVESINQVAQNMTGWSEAEAIGKAFQDLFPIVNEYTREPTENPVEKVLQTGHVSGLANHTLLIAKDGREIAIADSAAPIKDNLGKIYGVVLVFRDVTEERANLREIEYLSFHDQLTGLYNRRFFETELKRLDTPRNLPISLVSADVNGLKLTNDAFGHEAGDALLKKAAEVMTGQCRADDIIARTGGDEFVLLLPRTGPEETRQIVKRIQDKVGEIYIGTVKLSISMGWAHKDVPEMDISQALKQAEKYMYHRKLFERQSILGAIINTIIGTLHEKYKREEQHSQRVSRLSVEIGRAMRLQDDIIEGLYNMGTLHDIGKIAVPEGVFNKEGSLTPEEWSEIKRHPEVGYRILSSVNDLAEIAEYILAHHERWDGQGYPKGLRQKEIPLQARIMAVADAYDAMVSERSYRKTLSQAEAVDELLRNAGTQFDPEVVRIFVEAVVYRAGT